MEIHVKNCLISISSPVQVFNYDLIFHTKKRKELIDDVTN